MQTRTQRIYKKTITPDITKLIGNFGYSFDRAMVCYNPDDTEKCGTWDAAFNHHALWYRIINLLKNRGFDIGVDQTVAKCIQKGYYYGVKKNDIHVHAQIYPNGFVFEFHETATPTNPPNRGRFDNRNINKMPYLIKIALKAELNAIIKLAAQFVKTDNRDKPNGSVNAILNVFQTSHFDKKNVKSLEDLNNHDIADYNSKSKDGTHLKNGDVKYFYGHKGKLSRGTMYHNINNMWWAIINDTEYTNIACFHLFDYKLGTPLKKPLSPEGKIQRLHTELKRAEAKQNYERCIVLKKLLTPVKLYNVWSKKWNSWWGPNNSGYTSDKNQAGVYTEQIINEKRDYYDNKETAEAIPV
ncbi:MAG: hypothetical protein V4547_18270 [Bacteroidota bacterium]